MKKLYVIKFEDNTYYAGYKQRNKFIYHAKIYTSLSYAFQAGKRIEKQTGLKYEIKEIYMSEQDNVEMKLKDYEKLLMAFENDKVLWQTETIDNGKGVYEVEAELYATINEPIIKL